MNIPSLLHLVYTVKHNSKKQTMQIFISFKAINKSLLNLLMFLVVTTLVFLATTSTTFAQFGQDAYGQCAYGQACPTTPQPPEPPEPPQPPEDPDPPPQPVNNTTPTPPTRPKQSASPNQIAQPVKGFSFLNPLINLINDLPEAQKRQLPFYSWLLLALLALILLLQAMLDKHKINKILLLIKKLQAKLAEQKSFMRLVLHHLNTPLATSKSSIELLEKAQPPEPTAISTLKPTVLDLATTIDYAAMEVINDSDNSLFLSLNDVKKVGLKDFITKWYFILPISLAIVSGMFVNWVLLQTGIETKSAYFIYQIVIAIMVVFIFANALRLNRLTHKRRTVIVSIQKATVELEDKRLRIIRSLGTSLQSITLAMQTGAQQITNQQVRSLLTSSLTMLGRLSERMQLLFSATSPASTVSISALVTGVIANNQSVIEVKKLNVSSDIKVGPKSVIHATEFSFILNSLLENAVDFSKEGGNIDISVIENSHKITVKITDNGVGIKPENIQLLFKPFSTGEDVLTYNHDGLGLSLFIDKQLLDKINGTISINSEPNEQTVAEFTMLTA